jgi:hypothetical protein
MDQQDNTAEQKKQETIADQNQQTTTAQQLEGQVKLYVVRTFVDPTSYTVIATDESRNVLNHASWRESLLVDLTDPHNTDPIIPKSHQVHIVPKNVQNEATGSSSGTVTNTTTISRAQYDNTQKAFDREYKRFEEQRAQIEQAYTWQLRLAKSQRDSDLSQLPPVKPLDKRLIEEYFP